MNITPIKTDPVLPGENLEQILTSALPSVPEQSIVVVTSKIVSLCEGNVLPNDGTIEKDQLIKKEAEQYIEKNPNSNYGVTLTVKCGALIANAGIDESNTNGHFVLWPKNPHKSASEIWTYVKKSYAIRSVGVIISDSRTVPMRWGTLGMGISWCGFEPLIDYIGTPDVFGRKLRMTKSSMLDGLAAAAVAVMGEGSEQTPLAIISDIPFIRFMDRPPSNDEIKALQLKKEDDIYAPIINSPKWKKGGRSGSA